ncbi:MAG: HK97 family phage prohead protease [Alphaproteobacteria bacterium]|nr:MAG: HK97 family phage prohead protease [Alphaproteobacteria bacterium]
MPHARRACAFDMKSLTEDGRVTGYASVFDLVDAQDEQVSPGAFRRSLAAWSKTGRMPPSRAAAKSARTYGG